jgi:hypothetical protein
MWATDYPHWTVSLFLSSSSLPAISTTSENERTINAIQKSANHLATFRRKKPFSDDRATKLGARTRRQIAAGKV